MKKIIVLSLAMLMLLGGCAKNMKDGVTCLEEGKYEEAIAAFEQEIENEKYMEEAYRGLGIAYYEMQKFEEAIAAFEKALELGTEKTASIYYLMGTSYLRLDDYENMFQYYDKTLSMPDWTDAMRQDIWLNEIAVYERQYDWEAAKTIAEEYVAAYPEDERIQKEAAFLESR